MIGDASRVPPTSTRAEVKAAIHRLAEADPPILVVADFDGTLAVGSRDPAVAHIEASAQRALRHLARLAAASPGRVFSRRMLLEAL